jgi:hypothetical protein
VPSETYDSAAAVCPFCGFANDEWEHLRWEDATHEFDCGGCEKRLTSTLTFRYTFTTKAVEEPGG